MKDVLNNAITVIEAETSAVVGRQPDGSASTSEAKHAVVWSAETVDREGCPVRDPGSATYNAAIESIATREFDPAPFAADRFARP